MTQAGQSLTVTFKEGHVEADGFRIRYREAGQGETVVMLDGITWGPPDLHDALAQKYRVVALELPGFGTSPVNTSSQSVADLAETMARAAAVVAPDQYTLIGTSFGANVALWLTLQSPEKMAGLILISPTVILPEGGPAAGPPEQLARQLLAHPENAQGLASLDQSVAAQELALTQRLGGATHDGEAEGRLSEIQCATLAVFGSKDKMVDSRAARVYREKIPNCNVSLVYDAGHLIVAERPEALCGLVADFVERRETFIVERGTGRINP